MKVTFKQVAIREDLYDAGRTEDGERFAAALYYVFIELLDGRRFAHDARFVGAQRQEDAESGCVYFDDLRVAALRAALKLRRRIRRAGRVNLDHWREIDPAYGSRAYEAAQFDIVAREKLEDEAVA